MSPKRHKHRFADIGQMAIAQSRLRRSLDRHERAPAPREGRAIGCREGRYTTVDGYTELVIHGAACGLNHCPCPCHRGEAA